MHINIGRVSIIIEKSYNISKQGDRGESESDLIGTVRIVCTFYNITHDPALPSMDVIPSFLLFFVGLVVFQMMVTLCMFTIPASRKGCSASFINLHNYQKVN